MAMETLGQLQLQDVMFWMLVFDDDILMSLMMKIMMIVHDQDYNVMFRVAMVRYDNDADYS